MRDLMWRFRKNVGRSSLRLGIRLSVVVFLSGVIIISVGWIKREAIFGSIVRYWVVSDHLEPADAVVVLGGGFDTRPGAAARLYKGGLVKRILVSKATLSLTDLAETNSFDREALVKLGIPAQAITGFGYNLSNTYEEAQSLAHWAEDNRALRIIVPTEMFPSRRVRWILRRELGKVGVRVMIETVAPSGYDVDDWWQHKAGLVDFRNEVIKYLYYRMRY